MLGFKTEPHYVNTWDTSLLLWLNLLVLSSCVTEFPRVLLTTAPRHNVILWGWVVTENHALIVSNYLLMSVGSLAVTVAALLRRSPWSWWYMCLMTFLGLSCMIPFFFVSPLFGEVPGLWRSPERFRAAVGVVIIVLLVLHSWIQFYWLNKHRREYAGYLREVGDFHDTLMPYEYRRTFGAGGAG